MHVHVSVKKKGGKNKERLRERGRIDGGWALFRRGIKGGTQKRVRSKKTKPKDLD